MHLKCPFGKFSYSKKIRDLKKNYVNTIKVLQILQDFLKLFWFLSTGIFNK